MSTVVLAVLVMPVAAAEQVPVTVHIGEASDPSDPIAEPDPAPAPDEPGPVAPPPQEPPPDRPAPGSDAPAPAPEPDPAPVPGDVPQAAEPDPSPLPRTGTEALQLLRDAAAALAVGLLLVVASRTPTQKETR